MSSVVLAEPGPDPKSAEAEAELTPSRGIASTSFEGISNEDAAALLKEHDRLVWFTLRRCFASYFRNRRAPGADAPLDEGDLHAIGQVALLRAWLSWQPHRGKWTTHAMTCIRRSVARALGHERSVPEVFVVMDPFLLTDPMRGGAATETSDGGMAPEFICRAILAQAEEPEPDLHDEFERQEKLRWLEEALTTPGLLTPRQCAIIRAMRTCNSAAEVAFLLGDLTRQGVDMQYNVALEKLRDFLDYGLPASNAAR